MGDMMSDIGFSAQGDDNAASAHDELVRALTVERFKAWKPAHTRTDPADTAAIPTLRDGLPFEPVAKTVRSRKYRRYTEASRRSS